MTSALATPKAAAPATVWHSCYDDGWQDFITKASFAHPAKFSRKLIERIYDHMLAKGWLTIGDLVADPFGGIGLGGLIGAYRGLRWVGVELEPRFIGFAKANFHLHAQKLTYLGRPVPKIVHGDSRRFAELVGQVCGVVSSPPYADTTEGNKHCGIDWQKAAPTMKGSGRHQAPGASASEEYGSAPGQIGRLKSGPVDAVVSSPPYNLPMSQDHNGTHGGARGTTKSEAGAFVKYGNSPGQIEGSKQGDVSAVITSPPYSDIAAGAGGLNTKPASRPGSGRSAQAASQDTDQKYGQTAGQISQLKGGSVEGVVTSPPYCEQHVEASACAHSKTELRKPKSRRYGYGTKNGINYGTSEKQIGTRGDPETYWQAMREVYAQCFLALRPGGYMAVVVKNYVKDKQIVPLCDDTLKLLEFLGFELVERVHAMLVHETRHGDLFHGETRTKTERKSFFRRLAEKKGSPKIDFEEVLFCRKPPTINHRNP